MAAARDDSTIRLKKRAASCVAARGESSSGRSARGDAAEDEADADADDPERRPGVGAAIIATSSTIHAHDDEEQRAPRADAVDEAAGDVAAEHGGDGEHEEQRRLRAPRRSPSPSPRTAP